MSRALAMADLYRSGVPVSAIAERFAVRKATVYKALERAGVSPTRMKNRRPRVNATTPGIPVRAELLPRVDRDPCPRCNVRGDIGCKHRRLGS